MKNTIFVFPAICSLDFHVFYKREDMLQKCTKCNAKYNYIETHWNSLRHSYLHWKMLRVFVYPQISSSGRSFGNCSCCHNSVLFMKNTLFDYNKLEKFWKKTFRKICFWGTCTLIFIKKKSSQCLKCIQYNLNFSCYFCPSSFQSETKRTKTS